MTGNTLRETVSIYNNVDASEVGVINYVAIGSLLKTIKAKDMGTTSNEIFASMAESRSVTRKFKVRYDSALHEGLILKFCNDYYDIKGISEDMERYKVHMYIIAERNEAYVDGV